MAPASESFEESEVLNLPYRDGTRVPAGDPRTAGTRPGPCYLWPQYIFTVDVDDAGATVGSALDDASAAVALPFWNAPVGGTIDRLHTLGPVQLTGIEAVARATTVVRAFRCVCSRLASSVICAGAEQLRVPVTIATPVFGFTATVGSTVIAVMM